MSLKTKFKIQNHIECLHKVRIKKITKNHPIRRLEISSHEVSCLPIQNPGNPLAGALIRLLDFRFIGKRSGTTRRVRGTALLVTWHIS